MLQIILPATELYNEYTEEFINEEEQILELEHSLVSLSKWESKWCKPFLSKENKSHEEIMDYIRCMTINSTVNPEVYSRLTQADFESINKYIEAPMTATTINDDKKSKTSREIVTAELIYYWMIALQIPFECQYWHLNKLLTLVKVCNIKNTSPKPKSKRELLSRNAALNAARRKQLNTKG